MCGKPCQYAGQFNFVAAWAMGATENIALRKSAKLFHPLWQPCAVIVMGALDWRCAAFSGRLASVTNGRVRHVYFVGQNGALWDDNFAFFLEIMFNILNTRQMKLHKCLNTQQSMRMRKNRRFIRRVDDAYSI